MRTPRCPSRPSGGERPPIEERVRHRRLEAIFFIRSSTRTERRSTPLTNRIVEGEDREPIGWLVRYNQLTSQIRAPAPISTSPAVEVTGSGKRKRTIPAATSSVPRPYFALARLNRLPESSVVGSAELRLVRSNKPPESSVVDSVELPLARSNQPVDSSSVSSVVCLRRMCDYCIRTWNSRSPSSSGH